MHKGKLGNSCTTFLCRVKFPSFQSWKRPRFLLVSPSSSFSRQKLWKRQRKRCTYKQFAIKTALRTNFLYGSRQLEIVKRIWLRKLQTVYYFSLHFRPIQVHFLLFFAIQTLFRMHQNNAAACNSWKRWKEMQMMLFCVINFPIYRDKPHRRAHHSSESFAMKFFSSAFSFRKYEKNCIFWIGGEQKVNFDEFLIIFRAGRLEVR